MFLALYLIALGTGGIKPCVSSFGADQFDETDDVERKKKSSFFNWFYFSINVGAFITLSVLVWIQINVGWDLAIGVPAVAMAIAVVSLFSGRRFYRLQKPGGSPLTRIAQVVVASVTKSGVQVPHKDHLHKTTDDESSITVRSKLEHTDMMRFFDKAAVENDSDYVKGSAPVETLHCNPTGGAEIHRPIACYIGLGHHVRNSV